MFKPIYPQNNVAQPSKLNLIALSLCTLISFSACSSNQDEPSFTNNSNSSTGLRGAPGSDGESCWEAPGVIDQNGDGFLDSSDCVGPAGETGKSCWEDIGDINNDGLTNAADCRYSVQQQFSSLDVEDIVQGSYDNIIVPDDVESVVIAIQKMPTMANSGHYCARINLEKLCGDADGCSVIMTERNNTRGDDLIDTHRWQLRAENYELFFNPANQDQAYPEKDAGIMYRTSHAGSNHTWANTGDPNDPNKRDAAWAQGSHLHLSNYSRSDCNNFSGSFSTNQHAEEHVFTISVQHNFMGSVVITDTP